MALLGLLLLLLLFQYRHLMVVVGHINLGKLDHLLRGLQPFRRGIA